MIPIVIANMPEAWIGRAAAGVIGLIVGLACGCQRSRGDAGPAARDSRVSPANQAVTRPFATYTIRAGGPRSFTSITNTPASNRATVSFSKWTDAGAVFRATNREPHAILLWNARVQTNSAGAGTDGFGWDTVYDDYPEGDARIPAGSAGEFRIPRPPAVPWRVCVLFSQDWNDNGKTYSGNYEVIGPIIKE